MSEEIKKRSLLDAFSAAAQTREEVEKRAKEEAGAERIDRFRMPDEGTYSVRVLPLAPSVNASGEPEFDEDGNVKMPMNRRGCEFRVRAMIVTVESAPDKKGKVKKQYVPLVQSTQEGVGHSVDIIDEYVRIAKDMYADDEDVLKLLTDSQSQHRLTWNRQRSMYVLDMTDGKAKGPMLWQVSENQWKTINTERSYAWDKERDKAVKGGKDKESVPDPLCSVLDAWPLTITKSGKKLNTEYAFKIDRAEDKVPLTEEQMSRLVEMPRIPDNIYRFTRYQLEAEIAFLKQYDEKHDLKVCQDEEFLEAVEKLKGELPADDNSHFAFRGESGTGGGDKAKSSVTLDGILEAYDYIVDNNLTRDSEEEESLREDIRQFIEDNNLSDVVVVKHSKTIGDLVAELEEAMEERKAKPSTAPQTSSDTPKAVSEKRGEDKSDEEDEAEKDDEEELVARPRRRAVRPDEDEETDATDGAKEDADDEAEEERDETPVTRRRRRAL